MKKPKFIFLIRDRSDESLRAKKLLEDKGIEFSEIVSSSNYATPTLVVTGKAFSYKGIKDIASFELLTTAP